MNEELEVLKIVTERLNKAGIHYMISGSVAANYYTIPRMTRDIDAVIELSHADIDRFTGLFKDDFYIDTEMIRNEVIRQGMFNLIHNNYVIKIDFIICRDSEFQRMAFSRRRKILIEDGPMWFTSAEDLILAKLLWAKESHSEIQLRDVRNIMESVDNLDRKYIETWIAKLGLHEIFKEVRQ